MKQLLFLLLFPCLALAQYQGNAGQKITLGEQTTADGLVYRGLAADTTRKPLVDTMAYILLDTNTNIIWQYKKAVNNAWTRVGGSISSGVTGVLPVENGGTGANMASLPNNYLIRTNASGIFDTSNVYEANGFVGIGTNEPKVKLHVKAGQLIVGDVVPNDYDNATSNPGFHIGVVDATAASRAINLVHYGGTTSSASALVRLRRSRGTSIGDYTKVENNDLLGAINWMYSNGTTWGVGAGINGFMDGTTTTGSSFPTRLQFYTTNSGSVSQSIKMTIKNNGNVGIGTESPAVQLHTTGGVRFATFAGGGTTTLSVDNTGNLARTSSVELKKDVTPISYGLNEILQINPINFNWIDEDKFGNENENGFIAEDVMSVIPNVVAADTHGLFMDYTKLIPILTKAIQEQNLLIKALEQRILILENK